MHLDELTHQIIGLAMKIHRALGCGFLESVYHNALAHELRQAGLIFETKKALDVFYEDTRVGTFEADLILTHPHSLIIELKAVEALSKAHEAQLVNYPTATRINDGHLLNFGSTKLDYKHKFRQYRPRTA
jgi:GxxExxY protein